MANAKVTLNETTLMDVTGTTVDADHLLEGTTAIGPDGELVIGTASGGTAVDWDEFAAGTWPTGDVVLTGTSVGNYMFYKRSGITSVAAPNVTSIGNYGFCDCSGITSVSFPNVTSVATYGLAGFGHFDGVMFLGKLTATTGYMASYCGTSTTDGFTIVLPAVTTMANDSFRAAKIKAIDIGPGLSTLPTRCFYATAGSHDYKTIILRKSDGIVAAANTNSISVYSGHTVDIYVPSALISTYESATNWSTILARTGHSIHPIEGSIYENAYADGTPIT